MSDQMTVLSARITLRMNGLWWQYEMYAREGRGLVIMRLAAFPTEMEPKVSETPMA